MQSFTIEEIKKIHQVWKKSNFAPPVPPARGSLTHSQALSLSLSKRARDVTALRCSEPLRSGVGGASKALAIFCGMGPPGDELGLSLDRLAYKDGYNDYMMLVLW